MVAPLTCCLMVVPGLVVGLLTKNFIWAMVAFWLIWLLTIAGCVLVLAVTKGWPTVRQVFKPTFKSRLLPKLPPRD